MEYLGGLVTFSMISVTITIVSGQQAYVNNKQLDCYNTNFNSTTKGYICNGVESSCQSFLTFRSSAPYNSPATISYLLLGDSSSSSSQTAARIASINNIASDVATIPEHSPVIIPLNCSCYGNEYYQHNATYKLKHSYETYFRVANDTYQGLSTCQAMMDQNPYGDRNLTVGLTLRVPLRCACPTRNQTVSGFKYLLTYMVDWRDTYEEIAQLFGVDIQSILDANELKMTDIIFPFTPLLVPLTTEPSKIQLNTTTTNAPPTAPIIPFAGEGSSNSSGGKKWIYIGVGIAAAAVALVVIFGFLLWNRKRSCRASPVTSTSEPKKTSDSADDYKALPGNKSRSVSSQSYGLRQAIDSLTVYKFEDLENATDKFSEANRIKGTVYKGSFKGDAATVKVMKGDVSGEINILKKINHSNIIRLSGFCLHSGNTYLVYEFAENGSLGDWLHLEKKYQQTYSLDWKQRVQIAYDIADALNYLHNYANPPHIHKNLKTSNILLDANLRAKVANFGLARTLENDADGGLQLTRHVVGTQGYMAPEYIENGAITPKLDVFAFGVVMLELLSGKDAAAVQVGNKNGNAQSGDELLLYVLIKQVLEGENVREKLRAFMDPSLSDEYPLDLAFSMVQLAKSCVAVDLNARPSISEVFVILSKILSSSLDWDPSNELQRTTSIAEAR